MSVTVTDVKQRCEAGQFWNNLPCKLFELYGIIKRNDRAKIYYISALLGQTTTVFTELQHTITYIICILSKNLAIFARFFNVTAAARADKTNRLLCAFLVALGIQVL